MSKQITNEVAEKLCENFDQSVGKEETRSVFYDAEGISRLLGVESKKGILVRFAKLDDGANTVVLQSGESFEEFGSLCPPNCPPRTE